MQKPRMEQCFPAVNIHEAGIQEIQKFSILVQNTEFTVINKYM